MAEDQKLGPDDDFMWLAEPTAPKPGPCDRCRCDVAVLGFMLETRALSLCISCAQKFESDIEAGGGGVDGLVSAYECMKRDIWLIRGAPAGTA
jgi:hypothetical protein